MKIVNMVATADFTEPFDLEELADKIEGAEFTKSGAKWLKLRVQPENIYTAFYPSGKFLITGAKSQEQLDSIVKRILGILKDSGINVKLKKIILHNLIITDKVNLNIPLEELALELQGSVFSYEPEQFPALIFKEDGATFLIFSSGKIICTGVKTIESGKKSINKLKRRLDSI